jgi:mannose-6-phosphate isomerase-like protein (cupin superfamily)
MRARFFSLLGAMLLIAGFASAQGQGMPSGATGQNTPEMKFITIPGLPTCAHGSVQNGDPTKEPSFLYVKTTANCSIPWHWHTPNEHLMMVTGSAHISMKGGKPMTLRPGGFLRLPSHHVHQFHCEKPCSLYLYNDAAFDIHYVDDQGKEISPADAMKAVHETAATEMKPVS